MILLSLSISGPALLWSIAVIALAAITCTALLRWIWHRKLPATTAQPGPSALRDRRAKNIFRWRTTILQIGMILSLGFAILAFAWTDYVPPQDMAKIALTDISDELLISPPPTAPPKPKPPLPQQLEVLPEEEIPETEQPEFIDLNLDMDEPMSAPEPIRAEPPPKPPAPKEPISKVPEIVKFVEEMPRFPGCEDEPTKEARKTCSDRALLAFISRHIRYPSLARENGIEGTVVVSFVVETDGRITGAEVVRTPGGGLGDEALRVVQLMNEKNIRWIPGQQRHVPVRVLFNLPVRFSLE